MKKLTLIAILITNSVVAQIGKSKEDVNKFLFSSGVQKHQWNKSVFNNNMMFYSVGVNDDNYEVLVEAERILALHGKGFGDYDLDESMSDGEIDPIDVIYEKSPFRSQARVSRVYNLGEYTMKVNMTENISLIGLYKN
jgi:hypothetical protein